MSKKTLLNPSNHIRDYQRDGIRFLLTHPDAGLFYDPGLGKTLTTLLAFVRLKELGLADKMLVVAPLKVAKLVWQQEIAKWTATHHLTSVLLHGPQKSNLAKSFEDVDITIINYEGMAWLKKILGRRDWPWDVVCWDEVSKCKAVNTKRAVLVRNSWARFERHWGLTGTPASNHLIDLFGVMRTIDGGTALGETIKKYENLFFEATFPGSYSMEIKDGCEEKILKRIAPIVHRLDAATHLEMPERTDVWHDIEGEAGTLELYQKMEDDLMLSFDDGEKEATAFNAAVLWGKLQQITQGFIYVDSGVEHPQANHFSSEKMDVLKNIIDEAMGQPVLVMYKYRADAEYLMRTFQNARILNSKNDLVLQEDWNNKKVEIMLANPMSAGHGLNLQAGGHIMVYYALESSLERYTQANGRLHRQGQKNNVIIHHLNMKGTVDDDIREMLEGRDYRQTRIFKRLLELQALRTLADDPGALQAFQQQLQAQP